MAVEQSRVNLVGSLSPIEVNAYVEEMDVQARDRFPTLFTTYPGIKDFDWMFHYVDTYDEKHGYQWRMVGALPMYSWQIIRRGVHAIGMTHDAVPVIKYNFKNKHNIAVSTTQIDWEYPIYENYFADLYQAFLKTSAQKLSLLVYTIFKANGLNESIPEDQPVHRGLEEQIVSGLFNSDHATNGFKFYQNNIPDAETALCPNKQEHAVHKHALWESIHKIRTIINESNVTTIEADTEKLKEQILALNVDWEDAKDGKPGDRELMQLILAQQKINEIVSRMCYDPMQFRSKKVCDSTPIDSTGVTSHDKKNDKYAGISLEVTPDDLVIVVDEYSANKFDEAINMMGSPLGSFLSRLTKPVKIVKYPYLKKGTFYIMHKELIQCIIRGDQTQIWTARYEDRRFTNINSVMTFLLDTVDILPCACVKLGTPTA